LQFIQTSEGRLVPNGSGGYNYEYALKDLPIAIGTGNTRVMFSQTGEVLQDQSYYPFGMSMGEALTFHIPSTLPDNKYLYNGKELQDDFDLGWYDYGARFYDAAIGRFTAIDALTEKNHSQSGFVYAANNPIIYIDFMGLDTLQNGEAIGADGLTNTQWLESSSPGASPDAKKKFRRKNQDSINKQKDDSQKNQEKEILPETIDRFGVEKNPNIILAVEEPEDWSKLTDSEKILNIIKLIRLWRSRGSEVIDLRGLFLNFGRTGAHEFYINGNYIFNGSSHVFLQLNMMVWKDMNMKTQSSYYNEGHKDINGYEGDWVRLDFNAYRGEDVYNTYTIMSIYVEEKNSRILLDYLKQ
jgi:RHS repeat-associated protein